MNSKLMTQWVSYAAAACMVVAGAIGSSVARGDDRTPATPEHGASPKTNWADECQRLKREIRGLDQRIESLRRDVDARGALLADAKLSHTKKQTRQQEVREALVAGRDLLLDDRCTVKIGCKSYSKSEFAAEMQRVLADYQTGARELNQLCDLLAHYQSAYDTTVARLGEALASRQLAADALKRHETAQAKVTAAVAVVVAQSSAPIARQPESKVESGSALKAVVAEVDRVLADGKSNRESHKESEKKSDNK